MLLEGFEPFHGVLLCEGEDMIYLFMMLNSTDFATKDLKKLASFKQETLPLIKKKIQLNLD